MEANSVRDAETETKLLEEVLLFMKIITKCLSVDTKFQPY